MSKPQNITDVSPDMIDKWDALKALTQAAQDFGVTHRSLGVLKALMTFLPGRLISPVHRSAIVFPSNKTLSDRLNGMPDSTLRRHLAALVSAGIVSRHDSANRKRFARYGGQGARIAFGFDLSPLARRNTEIRACADKHTAQQQALQSLRATVAHLRQQLLDINGPDALIDTAQKVLRRQPDAAALDQMATLLNDRLIAIDADKMNTTGAQNERHIEDESINYSVSKTPVDLQHQTPTPDDMSLPKVLRRLEAFKEYYPEPIRHWHDLVSVADKLTQMMGIDGSVFKEAIAEMGLKHATIAVLSILERFADIENPGGYLRRLSQSARAGRFRAETMLA